MSYRGLSEYVALQVRLNALINYATDHGWRRTDLSRAPQVAVYQRGENDETRIAIPATEDIVDYERAVIDSVISLSKADGRTPEFVLRDLARAPEVKGPSPTNPVASPGPADRAARGITHIG